MSVQLRINSLQDRRPSVKANTRLLLRLAEVPDPTAIRGHICDALELNGSPCNLALASTAGDPWCYMHHQEWKELNARWSRAQKEAEKVTVLDSETAKQK